MRDRSLFEIYCLLKSVNKTAINNNITPTQFIVQQVLVICYSLYNTTILYTCIINQDIVTNKLYKFRLSFINLNILIRKNNIIKYILFGDIIILDCNTPMMKPTTTVPKRQNQNKDISANSKDNNNIRYT